MELPTCPLCDKGRLLPMSDGNEPYAIWICSHPDCAYTISKSMVGHTYYKGVAASKEKDSGDKKWTEHAF